MSLMTHPHPRQHHHPHVYQYIVIALVVVIALTGTLILVPSIANPKPAGVPAVEFQRAYTEYLRGEKVIYPMPATAGDVFTAYHLGEKILYAQPLSSSEALAVQRFGEKHVMSAAEYALWLYHLGEKDY